MPTPVQYATRADLGVDGLSADILADIDTATQDTALQDASSDADRSLAIQYTLPLVAPYPRSLVRAVCQIAAIDLLRTRGTNPESPGYTTAADAKKDALRFLDDVRKGIPVPGIIDSAPSRAPDGAPRVHSRRREGWGRVT